MGTENRHVTLIYFIPYLLPLILWIFLQVQNLIERCLQLYMNRGEVVRTLSTRAKIEPAFTTLGESPSLCLLHMIFDARTFEGIGH